MASNSLTSLSLNVGVYFPSPWIWLASNFPDQQNLVEVTLYTPAPGLALKKVSILAS